MMEGVALAKLYEIHIELYMVETRDITVKQTEYLAIVVQQNITQYINNLNLFIKEIRLMDMPRIVRSFCLK